MQIIMVYDLWVLVHKNKPLKSTFRKLIWCESMTFSSWLAYLCLNFEINICIDICFYFCIGMQFIAMHDRKRTLTVCRQIANVTLNITAAKTEQRQSISFFFMLKSIPDSILSSGFFWCVIALIMFKY